MTRRRKKTDDSNGVAGSARNGSAAQVSSPTEPTELLLIVQAAELILSKAAALCARQSRQQTVTSVSESHSFPRYINEARVAEIIGVSQVWLQRARSEGIGPRHKKIARRVVYRLDQVLEWVESGASAREHLSKVRPKKRTQSASDGDRSDEDDPHAHSILGAPEQEH